MLEDLARKLSAFIVWILTVIIIPVIYTQSRLVYSMLCTDTKIKLDSNSQFIQIGTLIAIFFSTFSLIASDMLYFSRNETDCETRWTSILNFQQFGKTMSYLVLLARLYRYYADTPFAYSNTTIYKISFIAVLFGLTAIFGIILFPHEAKTFQDQTYPVWCQPMQGLFPIAGGIIITQDICAAIGFFILIRPFNRVAASISKKQEDAEKTHNAIHHVAKVRVLSSVMLIATIVFTLLAIITGLGVFGALDLIVTPICLVLMTPTPQYDVIYAIICCGCRICCGNKQVMPTQSFNDRSSLINELAKTQSGVIKDELNRGDGQVQEMEEQGQTTTA